MAILLAGAALALSPAVGMTMGSGGMGGGSMGGGGMSSMPAPEPQYDPVQEYQRGQSAMQAGEYKDAIRAFEHVTDATPRAEQGWFMLGMAKSGAGDVKGAEKAYEKASKLDPNAIDAQREMALALIKMKQTDKATAQLNALKARAATCNDTCPQAADLKSAIDAVSQALSAGAPTASAATPSSALLTTPQIGGAAYVRAVSLINEHRFPEALAALDQAETAIGPHPDIITYKGYVWRKMGDLDRAEGFYREVLAMAPNHRGATEYYGELKVIRGDMPGAKAMLARLDAACSYGCAEAEELRRWIDHGGDPAS
ncbi:MAG: tetratricopeptide repeat protein [Caulobacterales bacterium]